MEGNLINPVIVESLADNIINVIKKSNYDPYVILTYTSKIFTLEEIDRFLTDVEKSMVCDHVTRFLQTHDSE